MMKIKLLLCCIAFLMISNSTDATFSIVAVDSETGQVGSAGASCYDANDGVIIASDLIPGKGAINAQARICVPNSNLAKAIDFMKQGYSPTEIASMMASNDQCSSGNSTMRQYGIVDFDPNGAVRAAAHTGSGCTSYANHIVGPNYAIQGNILLGQNVLDAIEQGFLNETGGLACKLMAALQGGKIVGADTRCQPQGVSTLSAFVRVAKSTDVHPNFWLELNVPRTPYGMDPIDSLQTLFDATTVTCTTTSISNNLETVSVVIYPNPASEKIVVKISEKLQNGVVLVFNAFGANVLIMTMNDQQLILNSELLVKGIYIIKVLDGDREITAKKIVID